MGEGRGGGVTVQGARASVWEEKKVLETEGGDGCPRM